MEETFNNARFKMLLQYKKFLLIEIAKQRNLDITGTKQDLAKRITIYESEKESESWKTISNGSK